MEASQPVPVDVQRVTKDFGEVHAVRGLSFTLQPGSITGFLGPNGAGKTTTLRMIGGLLRPTSGAVRLFGVDAQRPRARKRLGYMPADPVFLPHLSGRDNLDLLARLRGATDLPGRAVAAATLELPDADLDRSVGGYSSGMRQKLAIVAAMQHRPDVLVLDEPANRLDPLAHRAFCELLRSVAADGMTVLLSSHVLAEVEDVCDSVLLVREGSLLTSAHVEDLRERATRVVTITYAGEPPSPPPPLDDVRVNSHSVVGRIPADRPDLVRELLTDHAVTDLTVERVSLEDIVLDFYAGAPS